MPTFFLDYIPLPVERDCDRTLMCPFCHFPFAPPFRPNPSHTIDRDRRHRSNAHSCESCGKFFTVTNAAWKAAGYRI
jgi:hypothetical protein